MVQSSHAFVEASRRLPPKQPTVRPCSSLHVSAAGKMHVALLTSTMPLLVLALPVPEVAAIVRFALDCVCVYADATVLRTLAGGYVVWTEGICKLFLIGPFFFFRRR